jgi:two-component system response regulator (stage 0 sporulation protein F)
MLGSGLAFAAIVVIMDDPATSDGHRPVVLVVDDKLSIRMLIAELLRSNGYDVVDAANGRLAVDVLDKQAVDLVITDASMPELGGRGLFEHIEKRHPQLLDKVIVVTGHLREDTEFFQTRTRVPILYKPFGLDDLLAAIKKTIN